MTARTMYRKLGGMFAVAAAMCLVLSILAVSPNVALADDDSPSDCPTGNSDCAKIVRADCETDMYACAGKDYCGCRWRPLSGGNWYCYCIKVQ